jgi:hypothetical protein
MYEMAKKGREAMKSKARRLAGEKDQKVDSSDWSPAPPLNAEAKTGMRPVSRRTYKKGGKVVGQEARKRADKPSRATGGEIATAMMNKNLKEANEKRDGVKHIGALKHGGKAKYATGGGIKDKKALGAIDPTPVRAKAEHYKKGGMVKKAGGGGSWLEKMVGKPKTGSDMSQVGKMGTARYSQEDKGALDRALRENDALPAPAEAAESAARMGDKRGGMVKRKAHAKGGKTEMHPDEREDRSLVKKMVKKTALTGKKDGGEAGGKWIQKAIKKPGALHKQLGVPKGEKIPEKKLEAAEKKGGKLGKRAHLAETLKRINKYGGGSLSLDAAGGEKKSAAKTKEPKKVTLISVNIGKETGNKPPVSPADIMKPPMVPPMPPVAPPGAGAPPAAPPTMPIPGGPGGMPMPGAPGRKAGGRISKVAKSYKDMEAGAGSGEGRLQKEDIAKAKKGRGK